jgi:hypothetical protein
MRTTVALGPAVATAPFVVNARPMGLRAGGLHPSRLHELAADLEAETFAVTTRTLRQTLKNDRPRRAGSILRSDESSPLRKISAD